MYLSKGRNTGLLSNIVVTVIVANTILTCVDSFKPHNNTTRRGGYYYYLYRWRNLGLHRPRHSAPVNKWKRWDSNPGSVASVSATRALTHHIRLHCPHTAYLTVLHGDEGWLTTISSIIHTTIGRRDL